MNVKVPKGMNSPTVVIIGGGKNTDNRNTVLEKRLDYLEKRLAQQYKQFTDGMITEKSFRKFEKSFGDQIDKLKKALLLHYERKGSGASSSAMNKSFEAMFKRLETAIMKARPRMIPSPS